MEHYEESINSLYTKAYCTSETASVDKTDDGSVNKLFIRNNDGSWELVYRDDFGKVMVHKENWENVAFGTRKAAQAKLDLIEDERARENTAIPFTKDEARGFIDRHRWKFA